MKQFLMAALLCTLFTSCKKDDSPDYNSSVKAPLSVEFDNIAGPADLQLNTGVYSNAAGESFSITKCKYYVSNFVLTYANGGTYTVPADSCYFLVDESDEKTHEPVLNVPEGEYSSLRFLFGVDSLRNTMDISKRTGVLDPAGTAADMYRGLNSGYIFLNLEGTSPAVTAADHVFKYHIGGFGGYSSPSPNNTRNITLDLTARGTPKVKTGKSTNIHLLIDVLKALNGTTNMSFSTSPAIDSPLPGIPVANNCAAMFRHDHTEN